MTPQLTIAEASRLFAARKLSPVELMQDCFRRIRATDDRLNSFLLLTEERAMADASASEQRWSSGQARGRLDGIPIGHKDIYNTAGIRTTAHSRILEHNVPTEDALSVRKLADAGTVLIGKLATHEFAMGGPSFDLPWPPARNPWNPDHFTAGSSSGTGAAVAAGFVLGGTGSDTGGSIRLPAALCGITGIKPTYGLVSRRGVLPLSFTLDHAGPMAWTAEDCALLLQAMAGHDPGDPASVDRPIPDFTSGIGDGTKGLRVGLIRHFHETDNVASAATRAGIENSLAVLRELGATVTDVTLSPLVEYHACGILILITEAYAIHKPWLTTRFYDYGELVRDRFALGALVSGEHYVQALRRRRELCLEMTAAMADVDVLVTAAQPAEAPQIRAVPKWATLEKPGFTIPFNVTGYPAMSVCTGFGEGGLPVAMQIVARPFCEPLLLRTAHALERATPWRDKRPDVS
ncbi:MAG TPA: amidase [Bradyrhizobium sp.]|uniref:amidase n=1 Tax=Bradyrhizobium sp. TaxID=376 RepID=UPI002BD3383C|nr:amidase [Bradyrhizobium sp.]HLZ04165.1 amidase [Bradyrhizobium sp.]